MKRFKTKRVFPARFVLISCFVLLITFFCSCGKTQASPAETSSEAASTAPSETVYDAESDNKLLQSMKSGRFYLQEEGVSSKRHSVQFSFTRMEFFITNAKIEDPTWRLGPIAIKDGYIYSVCQNTHQIFVFKIQDSQTLIFCADRSNELTIQGGTAYVTVKDGDVFVWEEGETYWDRLK